MVVVFIMIGIIWYLYSFVLCLDLNDYIGDEVWYVLVSRNIFYRFGVDVFYIYNGLYGVNVVFLNMSVKIKNFVMMDWVVGINDVRYRMEYREFFGVYYEIFVENYEDFF